MTDSDAAGIVGFIFEMGLLKRARRTGWWIAGIKDPETIAEHSFRTAVLGSMLATLEGADPARVSLLCLFHDSQETRTGDVPRIGRRYLTKAPNQEVTADQLLTVPAAVASVIEEVVAEYEAAETIEAIVARDADKLECLIQAIEYRHQGVSTVQRWITSSRAALKTEAAIRIAEAALTANPVAWLEPPAQ